jgi:hypothetical protein
MQLDAAISLLTTPNVHEGMWARMLNEASHNEKLHVITISISRRAAK